MKKIKEFAALCGTSSKTLRFYDKIGLLEAKYTDPETGYRYYEDRQKDKYTVISLYKDIGFTLDEIKNDILCSDESRVLEILRRKEAELKKAHELCMRQIEAHEKSMQRQADIENGKISLIRYDDEGKIVITDGKESRIFTCAPQAMDICAEAMRDMFCSAVFVNIDLGDIEMTDEDRTVMVQTLEGTKDEVISLDFSTLFRESDHLAEISTVILMITLSQDAGLGEVTAIAEKMHPFFPDCVMLWGTSFDTERDDYAKLCIVGVY